MTYTHCGEIGDIWKHLPLAEILWRESPTAYWESHSASGLYELAPSPNQEYGVLWYLEQAVTSSVLNESPYTALLEDYRDDDGALSHYPGSPVIAMRLLAGNQSAVTDEPAFVFYDIDREAIQSVQNQVQKLEIQESSVRTVHGDGITGLTDALTASSSDDLSQTFAHIDPYAPMITGENGLSSWDLFRRLLEQDVKAMLWYGYQNENEARAKDEYFEEQIGASEFDDDAHGLWVSEIVVDAFMDSETSATHPGVFGSGVICGNVSDRTINRCREVGKELATIYSDAVLPDGSDGSLSFVEPNF